MWRKYGSSQQKTRYASCRKVYAATIEPPITSLTCSPPFYAISSTTKSNLHRRLGDDIAARDRHRRSWATFCLTGSGRGSRKIFVKISISLVCTYGEVCERRNCGKCCKGSVPS